MDSVGVFREEETDGNPCHIFSLISKTSPSSSSGEAATDLGGDHLSLESPQQPLFFCPRSRFKMARMAAADGDAAVVPYIAHFPITKIDDDDDVNDDDDDDDDDDDYDDDDGYCDIDADDQNEKICKHHVLPIFWCNNKKPNPEEFQCGACKQSEMSTAYYICLDPLGCRQKFHKECVESPLEIQNPSFPFLSFQLYHSAYGIERNCVSCKLEINGMFYHCPIKKVSMHPFCSMKSIPIHIHHPKRHPHTLTFFPKQAFLPCDCCGLVQESSLPTYICARCIFVVHQDCIYLPFVIKISRHPHRISFTSSLPSGKWFCGVCRQKCSNRFGAYSCNKCSDYFVHSKCAVREDVWDGKDLEGVPEEPEIVVDPFEIISDGIIHHFTHGHHLKLEVTKVYNEYTICQACVLPVYEGKYYSCFDGCDFVLHETCASAPRKMHHGLHPHPLMLKTNYSGLYGKKYYFGCDACRRVSCGFVYEVGNYMLDVRCASVFEPFVYEGHEHPLFLSLTPTQEREATCRICREQDGDIRKLSCIECNYVICFRCAALPYKVKYKHDEHFLIFQKGKEGSNVFDWCAVCERKIEYSSADGFYECDRCCTTLHVHCLLGVDTYMMKPGQVIKYGCEEVHIVSNNSQSRPLCHMCRHRCPQKIVFKWNNNRFCSLNCFGHHYHYATSVVTFVHRK